MYVCVRALSMRVYYVFHDSPLTPHWSDSSGLDALVISPDLSKPPPQLTHTDTHIYYGHF